MNNEIKIILHKAYEFVTWLLFTRRCPYCNVVINRTESLCEDCKEQLPTIKGEKCKYCGAEKTRCSCKNHKRGYDGITAPFYYEDSARRSIQILKFDDKMFVANALAVGMAQAVKKDFEKLPFDFITYVPFTVTQKYTRSYNQSELLAENLSRILQIPVKNTLEKLFETRSQHKMRAHSRVGNVFGVYDVREKEDVTGKSILLVDDVKTSGATLDECAWILKIRGAEKVYCVSAAITATKKKDKDKNGS